MAKRFTTRVLDFSGGLRSGVSEYGVKPKHFTLARNVEFRPYRASQVRKGTKRACSATLNRVPNTLMEWVSVPGTSKKYVVGWNSGGGSNEIKLMSSSAYTAQTLPYTLSNAAPLSWDQLNGALWVTSSVNIGAPFFYRSTNAANTFLTGAYPVPGNTLTLTGGAGGNMTAGVTYYYRLRWRFTDGSSITSTPQSIAMVANTKVTVSTIPESARTDYAGWALERTSSTGASTGPFYYVTGTAATGTTSYIDTLADADLSYESDDVLRGTFPGGYANGIVAMGDRLAGWIGSTLYLSQAIADRQDSGIGNWDARNGYDFGKDDGDTITTVIKQGDRMLVFKQHSVWALEGNTLENFRIVHIFNGAGAAGLRAAASMGQRAWFHGAAGLHVIDGNAIKPFGYIEVGDVLARFSPTYLSTCVVRNHLGQRLYIAFAESSSTNTGLLVYDQRFGTWSEWTNIRAQDILVPKVADFGDTESFLFTDPVDRASSDYRTWIGFYGKKDEVAVDGTGGSLMTVLWRTPWIDDGMPEMVKCLERLSVFAAASGQVLSATVEMDDSSHNAVLSLTLPRTGLLWDDGRKWGDGSLWNGGASDQGLTQGLPEGLFARRYRITFSALTDSDLVLKGYAVDGILQPERRFSIS